MIEDANGNLHAHDDGRFQRKHRTNPTEALTDLGPGAALSPDDIRTVDFTVQTLRDSAQGAAGDGDLDKGIIEMAPAADGQRRFVYWPYGLDTVTARWVTVDDRGEITDVVESFEGPDGREQYWKAGDDEWLHDLRRAVNIARLAFAGIYVHGQDNDGGYGGHKYVGGRAAAQWEDGAQIAKRIRASLKQAQTYGAIPEDLTYRVQTRKSSTSQSITITAEGLPDTEITRVEADGRRGRPHPRAAELTKTLDVVGNQWNVVDNDSQSDYFNERYFLHVTIPTPEQVQWQQQERERQATRRRT